MQRSAGILPRSGNRRRRRIVRVIFTEKTFPRGTSFFLRPPAEAGLAQFPARYTIASHAPHTIDPPHAAHAPQHFRLSHTPDAPHTFPSLAEAPHTRATHATHTIVSHAPRFGIRALATHAPPRVRAENYCVFFCARTTDFSWSAMRAFDGLSGSTSSKSFSSTLRASANFPFFSSNDAYMRRA